MTLLVLENFGFWFNFLLIIGVALFVYFKTKEFSTREFLLQIAGTTVLCFLSFMLFFSFTKDLLRNEILSSKAEKIVKEEEWEEEYDCSYQKCDKDGNNCVTVHKTCTRYIPEQFYIINTQNNKIYIKKQDFMNSKTDFGATEKEVYRSTQTSFSKVKGEGDIWTSIPKKDIWTAQPHLYQNYVSASQYTIKRRQNEKVDTSSVLAYPEIFHSRYGKIDINRFLTRVNLPQDILADYKEKLNAISGTFGASKQINPIIYVINDGDMEFLSKIDIAWSHGNKNDSIVLLNIDSSYKITDVRVLSWSKDKTFDVNLETNLLKKNILEVDEILGIYKKEILTTWVRKPMEEFSYLRSDISLPLGYQFLIILLNTLFNVGLYYYFLKNHERRY